ncbi:MAG: hypothetical protein GX925_04655 [Clostridiales bacterium]|nr:hypothetical protein [Clostridiales bacterium]
MLRKTIITGIILTLFLGIITPIGHGQTKSSILTKLQVEKLARGRLHIKEDYKLQYSDLYTRDIQQKQFWNLSFEKENKSISITMAADTGEIISFNRWDSKDYGGAITLPQEEAKEIAMDFIKSLEKERFKETEEVTVEAPTFIPYHLYNDAQGSDNYYFMFVRKLKGEFFPNNYFVINVSGVNGEVVSYEMKWDEAGYEGNKQLLSEQKARELFEKDDRLELKYVRLNKYNSEDSKNIVLTPVYIYAPKESDKIDAVTGRLLSRDELYNWNYFGPAGGAGGNEGMRMKEMASLDAGVETIPEEGVISKEKAEKAIIDILKGNVDLDDVKLNNTSYTNYYAEAKGKFWVLYWYSKEGSKYINAAVNAEDGKVLEISYSKNEYRPIAKTGDPEDTGGFKKIAKDCTDFVEEKVQKMFPGIREQLQLEIDQNVVKDENRISISSPRYIDKIPFEDNHIRMDIDKNTKEIIHLNYRWYKVEAQKPKSMLNIKDAHKILYDKVGFEKYLVQLKDLDKYKKEGLELPIKELLPVYSIKNFDFIYIDGATGKFLDYSGEEFVEKKKELIQFKDIKGHEYEKDILFMDKMGVLKVKDEFFKPNEVLLRKDALKWVVEIGWTNKAYNVDRYYRESNKDYFKDISKDDPYYKYIEAGVESGIIEKGEYFKPDEKISKIELTKWIINAMKQKELAKYSDIFKSPYVDKEAIEAENVGYVALAKYYNIFCDKNIETEFVPDTNLKRGEFIHCMYEFIKNYKEVSK